MFVTIALIIASVIATFKGQKDRAFFNRFCFDISAIRGRGEYYRLFSSHFLHVDYMHLGFNMFALYIFGEPLEKAYGPFLFALMYAAAMAGSELFGLFIHRNHPGYTAVGASGAISAIIIMAVLFFPGIKLGLLLLPIMIPGWLFAFLYISISLYLLERGRGSIGHAAHLGGSLAGIIIATLVNPGAVAEQFRVLLLLLLPFIVYGIYYFRKPENQGLLENLFQSSKPAAKKQSKAPTVEEMNEELDRILEKISRGGIKSISNKERRFLKDYSEEDNND